MTENQEPVNVLDSRKEVEEVEAKFKKSKKVIVGLVTVGLITLGAFVASNKDSDPKINNKTPIVKEAITNDSVTAVEIKYCEVVVDGLKALSTCMDEVQYLLSSPNLFSSSWQGSLLTYLDQGREICNLLSDLNEPSARFKKADSYLKQALRAYNKAFDAIEDTCIYFETSRAEDAKEYFDEAGEFLGKANEEIDKILAVIK